MHIRSNSRSILQPIPQHSRPSGSTSSNTEVGTPSGVATDSNSSSNAVTEFATTNPNQFESVMKAIASELHAAADESFGSRSGFLEALADRFQDAAESGDPASLHQGMAHPDAATKRPSGPIGFGPIGMPGSLGPPGAREQRGLHAAHGHRGHHGLHGHHGPHGHHGVSSGSLDGPNHLLTRILDAVSSALTVTQGNPEDTTSDKIDTNPSATTDTATHSTTVEDTTDAVAAAPATSASLEQSATPIASTIPQISTGSPTVLSSLSSMVDALKNS